MAGKFINKNQKIMIDSLVTGIKTILNNPYYLYSDKKSSIAQYYNINSTKTTLDEATRSNYSELGSNSPIRYNLIHDTFLYGIDKIDLDFDMGDNGLETNEIIGDAVVLPNTFIPYPGDFFTLDQIGKPYLFKVINVEQNTLDTGSVLYKINYSLAYSDLHGIDKQVVEDYKMLINNVGTNFKAVIQSTKFDLIEEIEEYTVKLKDYYNMIFYNKEVQTYVYLYNGLFRVCDSYLIEFIIRNKILKGATQYNCVTHQMYLPSTFGIDYDNTIFYALEERNINRMPIRYIGNLLKVEQKLSLLYAFPEDYYYMEYAHLNDKFYNISIFDNLDIVYMIKKNIKTEDNVIVNIIIKYFNNEDVTLNDLKCLKQINYCDNIELYYYIPIAIFCLEKIITSLLV